MKELKYMVAEFETIYKQTETPAVKITNSQGIVKFLRNIWPVDIRAKECFIAITLNRAHNIFGYQVISIGSIVGTPICIKSIAKLAIDTLASGVIIAHNHPSGNLVPSNPDITLTRKVKETLELMDVYLLDHIIMSHDNYKSFADEEII